MKRTVQKFFNWTVTHWVECDEGFKRNVKVKERPVSMIYEFTNQCEV